MKKLYVLLLALSLVAPPLMAQDQAVEDFIAQIFPKKAVKAETLWLTEAVQNAAREILGHPYQGLRLKYWHDNTQTAWVMEEIGKERPITIGVVIDKNVIKLVKVLAFRESRGGEVRYPFFTDQFRHLTLTKNYQLSENIDGVTGATMSVRAVTKVARFALYLHQLVMKSHDPT